MTFNVRWLGFLAASTLLVTTGVRAECEKPQLSEGIRGYSACKDWPAFDGQTITASSAFTVDPKYPDSYVGMFDLNLAVVDSASAKVLASFRQAEAFSSDAIRLDEVAIDTARYTLAPQVRAFGVRASYRGSSRLNPGDGVTLSLFVREGKRLRPVMEKLETYVYGGEWDGSCAGDRYEITRTVSIGKNSSHGYADLIIRTVTMSTHGEGEGDECQIASTTAKPELTTLRYDGKRYVLPSGFKGL